MNKKKKRSGELVIGKEGPAGATKILMGEGASPVLRREQRLVWLGCGQGEKQRTI